MQLKNELEIITRNLEKSLNREDPIIKKDKQKEIQQQNIQGSVRYEHQKLWKH